MSVIFSDDFAANGEGTTWADAGGAYSVTAGVARCNAAGSEPQTFVTTTTAHAAIADCEVTVTAVTNSSFDGGPGARITDADVAPTGYFWDCYTGTAEVYRHNNSSSGTLIGTGLSITLGTNKVQKLKVEGTGATVTLTGTYDGTPKIVTDTSASRLTAAGQTGFYNWSTSTNDWDNFSVDNLVSAGGTSRVPMRRSTRFFKQFRVR